jgi:6-pyruvoyltetrahydropterin/6-carboxytetrahydropterin synthase
VANTTAELLARYLGRRLLDALEQRTGVRPKHVRLGIDENFGQWGFCELEGE